MNTQINNEGIGFGKFLLMIIFILECFALPTQFYLLINSSEFSIFGAIVRFFSFFTVLTNSIVAICAGVLLFGKKYRIYNFFHKNTTMTAITVYIVIVGLVYNILLRHLQTLEGMHRITTEIFHNVVPLLFIVYWAFFVSKQNMPWKSIFVWLIYPLIYVVFTLLHGEFTNFYPYPFINIDKLGFIKAMQNAIFVIIAFIILSSVLIGIGKIKKNKNSANTNL